MEQQMQAGGIRRHSKSKIVEGKKKTQHWFTVTARNNKVLVTSETVQNSCQYGEGYLFFTGCNGKLS